MCEPVSIALGVASAGLGIASAASQQSAEEDRASAQYRSQYAQANAQREHYARVANYNNQRYQLAIDYQQRLGAWQNERYYENAENIQEGLEAKYGAMFQRIEQDRNQTLFNIDKAGKAADKGSAFVTVAASKTGTQGNSIRLAKQQYARAEAEYANIAFNNFRNRVEQSKSQMMAMRAAAQNQINRMMPQPMAAVDTPAPQPIVGLPTYQAPSTTPMFLNMGSAVLGGITTGYQMSALQGLGDPAAVAAFAQPGDPGFVGPVMP